MTPIPHRTILNKVLNRRTQVLISRIATSSVCLYTAYYSTHPNKKVKDVIKKTASKIGIKKTARQRMKRMLAFGATITCLGVCFTAYFGAPETDEEGEPIKDDLSAEPIMRQYILRACREFMYYSYLVSGPTTEKLLPDFLEHPYIQPKYTLVLEFTDVIVHPEWSYDKGWRFKKRPLIQHFLESLKDSYEIVIYTAERGRIVFPIIDAIDPNNIITFRLVHGATRFTGRSHVKTLEHLNRDLRKVIYVDWNSNSVSDHPENLFCIKRWDGNSDDTSLIDLASFLKTIVHSEIEDVTDVLKYYSKYDDPIAAFREKQERFINDLDNEAAATRDNTPFDLSGIFKFNSSR